MIMLPLYSQNTAAIQKSVGRPDLIFLTKGHVFNKQVKNKFAEFLKLI